MSPTLRIAKKERERTENFAKRTRKRITHRKRLGLHSGLRREMDEYHGDKRSISRAQKFANPVGARISSNIDESLAEALFEEIREK